MASIELKALHIERGICKRMLTNIERRVSETSSFTEQLIDVLLGEVQSTLNRFTPIQTQIEIFVDDDPKLKVHEENEGDSFNNRCVDLRLKLGHIAETCKGSSNGSLPQQEALDSSIADVLLKQTDLLDKIAEWQRSSPGATNSESSATRSKLPQLNLPSFDGKYIDWPQFRDAFENAIHNNDSLRDSEKMQYLKMYLTGGAAADISTIPISNQTYQSTWDSLKAQYNKKVHLVNAYIQQFMAQTQKKVENASDLQSASRRYKQIVDGLRALGPECFSLDMWLIYLMKLNMSENFRQEWEKGRSADQMSTIDEFFKFMSDVTDVMERASHGTSPAPPSVQKTTNKSNKSGFKTHHTNATKCPECEGEHALPQCEKFLALSLYERRERMAQHHLCYNCMKPHHSAAKCQSKGKCQKCGRRHHTLLHPPKMDPVPEEIDQSVKPQVKPVAAKEVVPQSQKTPEQSPTTSSTITTHHSAVHRKALLPTAIVNVRDVYGKYQACRVLIDGGGECTMMSEECAQRLALPRSKARIAVHGAGEVNVGYTRGLVHLEVVSRYDPNDKVEVQAYVMEKVTSKLPSVDLSGFKWDHIKSLQLADPQYTVPGKIDIILGAEYAFEINLPQTLKGDSGQPIAQLTIFGWIVGGRIDSPLNSITSLHTHYNLDEMLKRFWEVEESHLDKQPLLTEEEVMCEEHFTQTHSRDDTGRYVVKLPFKKDHKPLGNSSSTALARFQSLERKLSRDPDFHEQYKAFMGEYIGLNHMELVTGHDLKPEDESYFLPHQAVLRPTSETTKLRVVFDASATTRPNNPSLNDILAIGPTRQDDLLVLLLRFRTHKVAMSADVEKMYRQILVASEDRDYQRVFWRTNFQEKIQIFRLCTVTYGTSSAPFLAVRVLHQIAMDYKDDYPEACEVISTSFYMDDLLCGAESIEDGKKLQKEIQDVLGKGHFVLRKWASNSSEVLDQVPPDLQAITPDEVKAHTKSISALGLKWSPGPDNFSLVIDALPLVRTKRDLCAAAAKVFDPLGFICPVTINLKMMFQSLWLIPNLQWDDDLPDDTAKSYERVQTEFSLIQKIVIPRAIPTQKDVIEIHGFADASERAYGAVIYAKGMDADGNIEINIVIAKSKVAPLKPITIPRMELNAAVLLTQLVTKVKDSLGNKMVEVHAWSDSTIVLQWLQEPPRTWNNYVARRVYAIQEVVPPTHWRHVPTAQNPADCISRGVSPKELSEHTLWWHGPQWLSENEEKWPENKVKRGKTGEERSSHAVSLVTQNQVDPLDLLIERTSGHLKTVRYLAYWFRFIGNLRVKKEERKTDFLTVSELQNATTCILKHIQQKVFPVEYKSCGQGHPLPRSRPTGKLKHGLLHTAPHHFAIC
ncbi:uncharacterized protein LOC129800934 [Phlebotomus papatasi]|uniref:uncharacterized protein LOC129800934 n=1 Tax=Phlebotomus papatasi TaxID=29031 RepID=UPI002483C993|nr:uncharacterized protein LOC129800934 [Phlebotomus papatasi]